MPFEPNNKQVFASDDSRLMHVKAALTTEPPEIRRFSCAPNVEVLFSTLARLYELEGQRFRVKYVDDEKDLVTLTTDDELREALMLLPVLYLRVVPQESAAAVAQPTALPNKETQQQGSPTRDDCNGDAAEAPPSVLSPPIAIAPPSELSSPIAIAPPPSESPTDRGEEEEEDEEEEEEAAAPTLPSGHPTVQQLAGELKQIKLQKWLLVRQLKMQHKQAARQLKLDAKEQLRRSRETLAKSQEETCEGEERQVNKQDKHASKLVMKQEKQLAKQMAKEKKQRLKRSWQQKKQIIKGISDEPLQAENEKQQGILDELYALKQREIQVQQQLQLLRRHQKLLFCNIMGDPKCRLVAELKPERLKLPQNETAVYGWRVRNEGDVIWPVGTRLLPVGRNTHYLFNISEPIDVEPNVQPNDTVDILTNVTAKAEPGVHVAYFKLATPSGRRFGPRLALTVTVAPSAHPAATSAPFATLERSDDSAPTSEEEMSPDESTNPEQPVSVDWVGQMRQLEEMGIVKDHAHCMRLLMKNNGDLNATAALLLSQQ